MAFFDFLDPIIDVVGDFFDTGFGSEIVTAGIKTASTFLVGGPAGQQQSAQFRPQTKISAGSVATSRVPRPSTSGPPGAADVDTLHAEWLARMRRFASLTAATDTGTQIRRS